MIFIKSILFALAMGLITQVISDMMGISHSRPSFGAVLAFLMSLPNYVLLKRLERLMRE
jgi:hypothetical protein